MLVLVAVGIEVAVLRLLIVGGLVFEVAGRRLGLGRARNGRARGGAGRDLRKSDACGGGECEANERADNGTTGHVAQSLTHVGIPSTWGLAAYG